MQSGAAVVEFAFVLPVLVLILWGLATFGSLFYTQMTLSRAAADGVRSLGFVNGLSDFDSVPASVKTTVQLEVVQSLALSLIAPLGLGDYSSRLAWMEENVLPQVTVDQGACGGGEAVAGALRVRVVYPYENLRILPPIELPMIGRLDGFMPQTLTGCATARL